MSMTFEEAHDLLNVVGVRKVSEEMKDWHPAILGAMLMAVAKAKKKCYPMNHGDFNAGVNAVLEVAGHPPAERSQWPPTSAIGTGASMMEYEPSTSVNPVCYMEIDGRILVQRHLPCLYCNALVHDDEDMAAVNAHCGCLRKALRRPAHE